MSWAPDSVATYCFSATDLLLFGVSCCFSVAKAVLLLFCCFFVILRTLADFPSLFQVFQLFSNF
jgi:hypothetical protein